MITSDSVKTLSPDEYPFYTQEDDSAVDLKTSDIPQGPGSTLDSDTIDGFQASKQGPNKLIVSNTYGFIPPTAGGTRTKFTQYTNYSAQSAQIPWDDTIPQSSEGYEFMTISFTPSSTTSQLLVEAGAYGYRSDTSNDGSATMALFKDSESDARAAVPQSLPIGGASSVSCMFNLAYIMTSGTVSSITFKIRIGCPTAATFYFNGMNASRVYGGVGVSWIKVSEFTNQ